MIFQDDERLNKIKIKGLEEDWIREKGCAFMSLINLLATYHGLKVSPAKIIIWLYQMIEAGCFTESMDIIWAKAMMFFGFNYHVDIKPASYKIKKNEIAIACWFNEATGLKHFTTVTPSGKEAKYDPLRISNTVKNGKIQSYRVFKLVD